MTKNSIRIKCGDLAFIHIVRKDLVDLVVTQADVLKLEAAMAAKFALGDKRARRMKKLKAEAKAAAAAQQHPHE